MLFKQSELQFSCTTLQYEFDFQDIGKLLNSLLESGFAVERQRDRYVFDLRKKKSTANIKQIIAQAKRFGFGVEKGSDWFAVSCMWRSKKNLGKIFQKAKGLLVMKQEDSYVFERAIKGGFHKCPLDISDEKDDREELLLCYDEGCALPSNFQKALDCLRLVFIADDLKAGTVMNFGDPTPEMTRGLDWAIKTEYSKWIFADVTEKCNLNCDFCYLPNHGRKDISLKKLEAILKNEKNRLKDKEYGSKELGVTLGGGEPTLHPKLPQLLEIARKYCDYLTISTNSTNPEIIAEHGDLIDGVAVSAPFVYDEGLEHPLDYDKIRKNIRKIRKAVKKVCISTIVTSKMKPCDVFKVDKFASEAGATDILFLLYKPGKKELFPEKELARDILEKILELYFKKKHVSIDVCYANYAAGMGCYGITYSDPAGKIIQGKCAYPRKYCI